jgi:protein involved in polysaccharide export with SLBB domain
MNRFLFSFSLLLLLASCSFLKRTVNVIPVPSLSGMKKMIPKISADDSVGGDDPFQQFSPSRTLGYGDTLRIRVCEGVREAREVYEGLVMVERDGSVTFEDLGQARFGGRSLMEARSMTESVMRAAGHTASRLHVHLISVENVPLITVDGNVGRAGVYPYREGARVSDVVAMAGGRGSASYSRAVYVTHRGQRRFFTSAAAADAYGLEAGDIIALSMDL